MLKTLLIIFHALYLRNSPYFICYLGKGNFCILYTLLGRFCTLYTFLLYFRTLNNTNLWYWLANTFCLEQQILFALNSKYFLLWTANTFCYEQQILSTFSIFSGLARRLLLRCGSRPVATGNELINILRVYKMCLEPTTERHMFFMLMLKDWA